MQNKAAAQLERIRKAEEAKMKLVEDARKELEDMGEATSGSGRADLFVTGEQADITLLAVQVEPKFKRLHQKVRGRDGSLLTTGVGASYSPAD